MNKDYRDFGINVITPKSSKWARCKCTKCTPGTKAHDNDLAVNVDEQFWICHRCGSTGNLKYGWTGETSTIQSVEPAKSPAVPHNIEGMYKYFESRRITR